MEKTTRDTVQTLLSTKRNLCGPRIRFIPLHSTEPPARGGAGAGADRAHYIHQLRKLKLAEKQS